jgi:hypothetical protein
MQSPAPIRHLVIVQSDVTLTPSSLANYVTETVQICRYCQLSHQITNRQPSSHLTQAQRFKMAAHVRYVFGGLLYNAVTKSEYAFEW